MLIVKSLQALSAGARVSDDASVSSADPATVVALQPSPSRTRPIVTATGEF